MIEEKRYLRDDVAGIIFTDESLHEYIEKIVSKALDIDIELVRNNLVLKSPRINANITVKNSIVDAIYEIEEGMINIEINYCYSKGVKAKNMRYICQLVLNQIPKKAKDKLKPIYQININNFDIFKRGRFIYRSVMMEESIHEVRDNFITIVDIDVDFLSKIDYTKIKEEESDSLEKLLYIFVCDNKERLDEVYIGDKIMDKVREKISCLTDDFAEGLYYDREELMKEAAKEMVEEEKALEIAKNLLNMDMNIEDIAKATGLTTIEIKRLQKED